MSLIIFSDDFLFYQGMQSLARIYKQDNSRFCIIDIRTFTSLHELRNYILTELTPDYLLFFIKGHDMLSKILSPLAGIQRCAPLTEYLRNVSERKWYTVGQALEVVTSLRELRKLTKIDMNIVYALRSQKSIRSVSSLLHCSKKATYQRVISIARKMNLCYSTQLQYFLHREYTLEELKKMNNKSRIDLLSFD